MWGEHPGCKHGGLTILPVGEKYCYTNWDHNLDTPTAAEVNLFPIGNGDDFCSGEGTDKSLNYILHQTYSGNENHAFIVNFVSNVLED